MKKKYKKIPTDIKPYQITPQPLVNFPQSNIPSIPLGDLMSGKMVIPRDSPAGVIMNIYKSHQERKRAEQLEKTAKSRGWRVAVAVARQKEEVKEAGGMAKFRKKVLGEELGVKFI